MKVLIFQRYMEYYSGAENVVNKLSSHLKERGIDNVVIALNVSDEVRKICEGVEFIVPEKKYPAIFRSAKLTTSLGIIQEILALRKLLKKNMNNFDLINVHNFPATWALYGLKKKPVVWMCNEAPDFYYNPEPSILIKLLRYFGIKLDRYIIRKTIDTIVTADAINAQRVKDRYDMESHIIPYGIDIYSTSKTENEEVKKRYGIDKEFVISQVGVLSPQKNQLESVKALKALVDLDVPSKLILAGQDKTPYKKIVVRYIEENNLEDKVIFTGHIEKKEVAKIYNISDLCLFPVKEQGGWLAPFEALSLGRPVVVSPTMGAADLLKQHNFGIVVDNIPQAIREIYANYNIHYNKAQEIKKWVNENLTWKNFTDRMIKLFEETLKGASI